MTSVNGTKIIEEVISQANSFLEKKERALQVVNVSLGQDCFGSLSFILLLLMLTISWQRLYDAAKIAEESYEEDLTLTLRRVHFFNVKGSEAEEEGALTYMPSFGQNVSLNNSGVHIPLEIYEGCK